VFQRHFEQLRRDTMVLDVAATMLSMVAALGFRWILVEPFSSHLPYAVLLLAILPLWGFLLTFFGAYRDPASTPALHLCGAVVRTVLTGLVAVLAFLFFLKVQNVSRVVMLTFAALDIVALSLIRVTMVWQVRQELKRGEGRRRILVVGSGNRARRFANTITEGGGPGIEIVGFLDPDPMRVGEVLGGARVLGTIEEITPILKAHVIDEVILAVTRNMMTASEKVVRACEEEGVKIGIMADLFDVNVARMSLDAAHDIPLLTLEPVAHEEWQLLVKRCIDLSVSVVLLPLLLPLMAAIALAIKLDSPGPALFIQPRVGLGKRTFRMMKFRTMVKDGERLQASLEERNEAEGPVFKIADDPRITRVGRFLRRTSLDELPQLLNVFRGDMSLVGPRPLPLRDVNLFDRGIQRRRFSVKPGITGLWQVSGRSNLTFAQWLELDLEYIDHWSLGLDVSVLLRTLPAVFCRTGAA
jgi:exopolysaccharide biosynthesis polyprenyl glycosylphosphotransferase